MSVFRRFLALLLLLLLLIFCAANTQPVTLSFPGWQGAQLPLFLPILAAFFIGVVLALLGQSLYSLGQRFGQRPSKAEPSPSSPKTAPPTGEPSVETPSDPISEPTSVATEKPEGDNH